MIPLPVQGRGKTLAHTLRTFAIAWLSLGAARCTLGDTTINPTNRYAFGANVSWLDWLGDTNHGVVIGPQVCSGYIFSPNLGWINLGNGSPTNGVQYQNLSADDFGVNVDGSGNLRGFAFGANIGWINFETNGAAKLDLASGQLSGFAFSATCGWISLSNEVAFVQTQNTPVIFSPPQSQIATIGQTATFRVVAGGLPPLSYQWLFNGTNIPGATLSEFSRANSQATDAGEYSVVITNSFGGVTSAVAVLVIGHPEIAVEQPAGSVLADGVASLNFGTVLAGGNSQLIFTIRNTGNGDLLGLAGSIDGSDAADFSVTANPPPTVPAGGNAAFTIKFNPHTSGAKLAAFHLFSNDADESPFDIALTGSVQPPAGPGTILTIAGNGSFGFAGDGGAAVNASFSGPSGLAIGPDGTLYVADSGNYRVRAIHPANGTISTVAGHGPPSSGFCEDGPNGDGGPATSAQICDVFSVALDRQRNTLYFPGISLARVRQVNLATDLISNFAGVGQFSPYPIGEYGDGGPAAGGWFVFPFGVAVGPSNNVYITDMGHCRLRKVEGSTGLLTTIAGRDSLPGLPLCESTGDGGLAIMATFSNPQRVTVDSAGNVFVLDNGGSGQTARVRRIDALSGMITRVAGGGTNTPGPGPATNMNLGDIRDIAVDNVSRLFIANATQVFRVDLATGQLTAFAGDGTAGFSGDHGPAPSARFNGINGITLAPGGGVVIADSVNQRIRYVVPDSVNLSGDSQQTDFYLPWVSSISGDVIIVANSDLSTVSADTVTSVGGSVVVTANSSATGVSLGSLTSVGGSLTISDNPSTTTINLGSLSSVSGDLTITSNAPDADVNLGSLCEFGGTNATTLTLQGGTFTLTHCLTLDINATLAGSAILDGSVTNKGTISPGFSPGHFGITGNLVLGNTSRVLLDLGGYAPGESDFLNVNGGVTLGGTLAVRLIGHLPGAMTNGASFTLLNAGAPITGAFANVPSGGTLTTTDGAARFTVLYASQTSVRLTDAVLLDSDGDGLPDAHETLAGTDPNNAASVFRIVLLQPGPGGLRITWSAVGGKSYVVQTNSNLTQPFADFSPVIAVSGVGEFTTNFSDPGVLGNVPARHYRIRLGP